MQQVEKTFTADGSAINIDFGFAPDRVTLIEGFDDTNPNIYEWFKSLADAAGNGQYGVLLTGSTGVVTNCADANNGFIAYSTVSTQVLLPAPNGNGEVASTIADYSTTTTYTARSTTALGSVVRPTTHNGYVYECTTASGGAAGTEPTTWGTVVGGTTTAGSGDVWTCREESIIQHGGKGITVGATLSTDGDEWLAIATKYTKASAGGDSATYDPV